MHQRAASLLALVAIGCEFLVPLDYTGGKEGSGATMAGRAGEATENGGSTGLGGEGGLSEGGQPEGGVGNEGTGLSGSSAGGSSNAAGTSGGGGTGGSAGSGASGGDGATSGTGGSVGGTDGGTGGDQTSGGLGATGGMAGHGGHPAGGRGGHGAGMGGAGAGGAGGMQGGMSGAGMAGAAGCNADLMTDATHCGSCTNVCDDGVECEGGLCITSPCVGICDPVTSVPLIAGDGYREENIGISERCFEAIGYAPTNNRPPALVCWNFTNGRTLKVNGVDEVCMDGSGAPLPMGQRAGGYCLQPSAAPSTCACGGFVLPLTSNLPP